MLGLTLAVQAMAAPGLRAAPRLLRIGGTGAALATMRKLGAQFTAREPGIAIDVPASLGTRGGLAAVASGVLDLALASRAPNQAERGQGLVAEPYAITPMILATHAGTAASGIATAELPPILRGTVTAWPDGTPLRLIRREAGDSAWTILGALSPDVAAAIAPAQRRPGLITAETDQDNVETIERLRGSIGMTTLGQVVAERRRVKALALDGVTPDVASLAAGRYPMTLTLQIAWKGEPGVAAALFLDFLRGPEAAATLQALGHVVPERGA